MFPSIRRTLLAVGLLATCLADLGSTSSPDLRGQGAIFTTTTATVATAATATAAAAATAATAATTGRRTCGLLETISACLEDDRRTRAASLATAATSTATTAAATIWPTTVIITTAEYGYKELAMNWSCQMAKLGVRNAFVWSLDLKLHLYLEGLGYNSFYSPGISIDGATSTVISSGGASGSGGTSAVTGASAAGPTVVGQWNSDSFNDVVHMKTRQIQHVIELGYHPLFVDIG